jgi:hypothetical protein
MINVCESGASGFSVSPNPLNWLHRYSRITSTFAWTWRSSSLLIRSSLLRPFVIVIASPKLEEPSSCHFTHSSNLVVMMLDNGAFFKLFDNERLTKSALTLSSATYKTPRTENEPSGHQTVEHHAKPTYRGSLKVCRSNPPTEHLGYPAAGANIAKGIRNHRLRLVRLAD